MIIIFNFTVANGFAVSVRNLKEFFRSGQADSFDSFSHLSFTLLQTFSSSSYFLYFNIFYSVLLCFVLLYYILFFFTVISYFFSSSFQSILFSSPSLPPFFLSVLLFFLLSPNVSYFSSPLYLTQYYTIQCHIMLLINYSSLTKNH